MTNPNFKKTIDLIVRFVVRKLLNGGIQTPFRQGVVADLAKRLSSPEERTRKENILRFSLSGSPPEILLEI